MLHCSMLPVHRQFGHFLANLRYIVVDEGHAYRGVFGCHAALVLRRLRRICQREYRRCPQFIVASATIANPQEHIQQLLGTSATIVSCLAFRNPRGHPSQKLRQLCWAAVDDLSPFRSPQRGSREETVLTREMLGHVLSVLWTGQIHIFGLQVWSMCMWCPRMGPRMDPRALCCGTHPLQPLTARARASRGSTCRTLRAAREAAPKGEPLAHALNCVMPRLKPIVDDSPNLATCASRAVFGEPQHALVLGHPA